MPDDQLAKPTLPVPARRTREAVAYVPTTAGPVAGDASPWAVFVIMWHRRLLVLACVVLAMVIGAVYLARATPLYSSSSLLYVQQSMPSIVSEDLMSRGVAGVNLTTQCQLIGSTAILSQALRVPGVAETRSLRGSENPVGTLRGMVKAEATKDSELITVSVTSPYAADVAIMTNGVVQAYIDYQGQQHTSHAVEVARILQKEVDSHERDLKDVQQQMLELRKANPQLALQFDKRDADRGHPSDLAAELSKARFRLDDLRSAVRKAEQAQSQLPKLYQLIDVYQLRGLLPPANLPQASADYRSALATRNRLADADIGQANPGLREADAEVDRAREEVDQATQEDAAACLDTIRVAADTAGENVRQLQQAFEDEQKASIKLSAQEAEYDQLAAAAERNERALDVLDGRLKDIHFTEDVGPMSITVLETAKPTSVPVSPVRSRVLGMSLVGGLMAGLVVSMLADRLDQRLRSVEEVTALIHAHVLGVIPRVVGRSPPGDVGRIAQLKPRSGVAEAFRTVRTAIYFGGAEDRSTKTILVTSPAPADGKSSCASNLAIAVAQAGRRVLLIDADCRRPVQHKTFRLDDVGAGLTGVLTGQVALAQAVRTTDVERLDVLPCGPLPHNPAELLDSQSLLDLLAEASRLYDQVLIDSPPVTVVSDARVLAASCDATIVVLRAEQSTRRGASLAWNALTSVGANLLGVVLNDITRQATDGYGYTYYYGYGRYGQTPAPPNGDPASGNGHRLPVESQA